MPVRFPEGVIHGFLALTTLDGETVGSGDSIQTVEADRVTNRLLFRFEDGSISDETTVFSQRGSFRLLSYRQVQQGPTFKEPIDLSIDAGSGKVTVKHNKEDGEKEIITKLMTLPPDLANGLVVVLLKNLPPGSRGLRLPMLAATPQPRLIELVISPAMEEPAVIGATQRKVARFTAKVEIGGLLGFAARLLGKLPPDSRVWIYREMSPTFVKSESPLYMGGPVLRTQLVGPTWPAAPPERPVPVASRR